MLVLEKKTFNGRTISTSKIKDFLISGDIDNANSLLFKPYHIKSEVVKVENDFNIWYNKNNLELECFCYNNVI